MSDSHEQNYIFYNFSYCLKINKAFNNIKSINRQNIVTFKLVHPYRIPQMPYQKSFLWLPFGFGISSTYTDSIDKISTQTWLYSENLLNKARFFVHVFASYPYAVSCAIKFFPKFITWLFQSRCSTNCIPKNFAVGPLHNQLTWSWMAYSKFFVLF